MKQPERTVDEIVEEFEATFEFQGLFYKGQRHWKTSHKRRLVSNWLTQTLQAERQKREEMVEAAYRQGYEQGKCDGSIEAVHPTHAIHEPNLYAKSTGDNSNQ